MKATYIILFLFTSSAWSEIFDYTYPKKSEKVRGIWIGPLSSLVLPGANQWYEGQLPEGAIFSGVALAGLGLNRYAQIKIDRQEPCYQDDKNDPYFYYQCNQTPYRLKALGNQMYMASGGLSAYYSFQMAMKQRKEKLGEYGFIKEEDTINDVVLAPFKLSFLTRWTSWVPLGLLALGMRTTHLRGDDMAIATGESYNAGVWEEGFFRGYLMPAITQSSGSPFLGNFSSNLIFAAGHLPNQKKGNLPFTEFLAGYYLGWVTQRNKWSIQESVFIHFWVDVIGIVSTYSEDREESRLTLYLPLLQTAF